MNQTEPLSPQVQAKIVARLRLAEGFVETAEVTSSSSEYAIRNSMSRMYYGLFHASLALMATDQRLNIENVSRNHGMVHQRLQQLLGKTMTVSRIIRELYEVRRRSDYEADMFSVAFQGNIETARRESILLLKRAKTEFYWLYHQARKSLK